MALVLYSRGMSNHTSTAARAIIATVCPDVLGARRQVGVVTTEAGVVACMHCCAILPDSTAHRTIRQGEL